MYICIYINFRCQNYDAIVTMSQELNIEDDSNLLLKCSNFFMIQGHYNNAVNLLAMANKVYTIIITINLPDNLYHNLLYLSLKKL